MIKATIKHLKNKYLNLENGIVAQKYLLGVICS